MGENTPEVLDMWLREQVSEAELLAFYRWVTRCALREHRDDLRAAAVQDSDCYTAEERQFMLKMADALDVDAVSGGALIRCLPLTLTLRSES
jgi:hypothetical protein